MIIKIILGFIVMASCETANGIFRVGFLYKKLGRKKANIVSFFIGTAIVTVVGVLFYNWIEPEDLTEVFFIGSSWMALMILFDLYVGKVLFKLSWKKVLEDFNVLKGNLLALGMIYIFLLPIILILLDK
ncbi:MAG: hypothetical protein OIF32_11695 [Campylobacterales bacterium]|nr:hypothetical protein [Campylobacterales bacterium]